MSNIDKYTNFISEQVRKETGSFAPVNEGIANQRKGSKSSSGVSYDDIKLIKKHFKDHGFHSHSGVKTKEGTHRISFQHSSNRDRADRYTMYGTELAAYRNKKHAENAKDFEKAVKSSPVPIHHHETVSRQTNTKWKGAVGMPVLDPHHVYLKPQN